MNVNKNEIFRYLGYKTRNYDEKTVQLVDTILTEAMRIVKPRFVFSEFPLQIQKDTLLIAEKYRVQSENLRANLSGCDKVILFAATLGVEADMLIKRLEVNSISKAAVAQATFSAIIEAYCNEQQEKIRVEQQANGYFLRPRFSAGYGDFALENQKMFFELLGITKKIGVQLNEQYLMIPTKSVTAVIGLTRNSESCNIGKCKNCNKKDCEFRDEF